MSLELEKFENSIINRPDLFEVDHEDKYRENKRQHIRLIMMDKRFTEGMYYKELLAKDPRISNKAFRLNILNIAVCIFKETTMEKFFNLSAQYTLDGVFRGTLFLLENSINQRYYPLKTTILEHILNEILVNNYPTDLSDGWKIIRSYIIDCFDPVDYEEYFNERKDRLHTNDIKIILH